MTYEEFQETNCMTTVTVYFKILVLCVKWTSLRPLLGPQNKSHKKFSEGKQVRHDMEASVIQGLLVGMAVHTWVVVLVRFYSMEQVTWGQNLSSVSETLYVYKKQDNNVS